jgi:hypothetical protein
MRVILFYAMLVMTLTGCATRTDTGTTTPQPGGTGRQAKGDFSTPKAAVETFIAAAAARDADLLSQSVADNASGEFAKLRDKTAGQEDLDGLAQLLQGGEITDVKVDEPNSAAVVAVKLKSRYERIKLTRAVAGWKIVDF